MDTWHVRDVIAAMDAWYPPALAEEWDRVGLVVGDPDAGVHRVLLAVDPVAATVTQALRARADLLVTHHPLYLRGTSSMPVSDPKGALVTGLIRAGVSLFVAHTNADAAPGGVGDALADLVGIHATVPLVPSPTTVGGREAGHGRIGSVPTTTLGEFASAVARVLPAGPHGLLVGGDPGVRVSRVAVSGGAGDTFLAAAREAGADVFLTGDLRHHPASEHLAGGAPWLLGASHWASEWPWLPRLAARLRTAAREAGVPLDVVVSREVTEPWSAHLPTSGPTGARS